MPKNTVHAGPLSADEIAAAAEAEVVVGESGPELPELPEGGEVKPVKRTRKAKE